MKYSLALAFSGVRVAAMAQGARKFSWQFYKCAEKTPSYPPQKCSCGMQPPGAEKPKAVSLEPKNRILDSRQANNQRKSFFHKVISMCFNSE